MPKRLGGSCGKTIAGKTNRKRCKIKAVGDAARWRSSKSGGAGPTKTKQPLDKQYQSWGFVSLLEPPLEIRAGGAARRMTRRSTNRKSCSKFARIIIIVVATPLGCTWDTFMQRVCVWHGVGGGHKNCCSQPTALVVPANDGGQFKFPARREKKTVSFASQIWRAVFSQCSNPLIVGRSRQRGRQVCNSIILTDRHTHTDTHTQSGYD